MTTLHHERDRKTDIEAKLRDPDPALREEEQVVHGGLRIPARLVDELSEPFGNSIHQTRSA